MIPKTITITHLGAETCVTGSCHLIRFQPDRGGDVAILGSCFIQFSFPSPDKTPYRVTFSGDLGCRHTPIIPDPDMDDCRDIVEGRTLAKNAIHWLSGYSAHADQQTLCDWVNSMPKPPGEIRLVHGEPEAQKALRSQLDILF